MAHKVSSFNMERGEGGNEDVERGDESFGVCVGGSGKMMGSHGGAEFFFNMTCVVFISALINNNKHVSST